MESSLTLTAVCEDDIDGEYFKDKHVTLTQNDDDDDNLDKVNSQVVVVTNIPDGEVPQAVVGSNGVDKHIKHDMYRHDENIRSNDLGSNPRFMGIHHDNNGSVGAVPEFPNIVSPINELILKQFTNNYYLFAKKQTDNEVGLVIRALLLNNNEVIYNYSFNIINIDIAHNAMIAIANVMCNLYLAIATKGDTLTCSLGAGHNGVRASITRNVHISNFIATLNKIKVKTSLYGGNTINENLVVAPNKKTLFQPLMHT